MVTDDLLQAAEFMLFELCQNRLRVLALPPEKQCKIRVVVEQNPPWYQEFCATYTAGRKRPRRRRKHDTLIKRRETMNALERMSNSADWSGVYQERLIPFVLKWAELGGEWR